MNAFKGPSPPLPCFPTWRWVRCLKWRVVSYRYSASTRYKLNITFLLCVAVYLLMVVTRAAFLYPYNIEDDQKGYDNFVERFVIVEEYVLDEDQSRLSHVCLYVYLSVCMSDCMSVCLSFCMCVSLPVCLSVRLYVCLIVSLSVCTSDCMSVCMTVCLYVCQSVCMSLCLSSCLSVRLNIDISATIRAKAIKFVIDIPVYHKYIKFISLPL